eukprot:CAMPEP_0185033308 /NCGR_PEP_ID=MMETSP1103-20130426/22110_1 /TAXON_ID=36769 /ORGANISM="Paraphysomonas bandaiensis, Strain Caron Lab Isolate" /LENGTH=276 /DNA_ID=CAMNT_0027569527 /DNA_START=49 /DNA_END=879 /DNA_ORIENTATION=-
MGCAESSEVAKTGETALDIDFLMDYLNLNKSDIKLLKRAFRKIDLHKSGTVDFDEFCVRVKCEPTQFLESIFGFFSSAEVAGKHGHYLSLNFSQFALFVCFFLTLDEPGLAQYLYKILTLSEFNAHLAKKEILSLSNMEHNIKCLFGKTWGADGNVHKKIKKMDIDKDGKLTKEEFVRFCQTNRSLMFPVVAYQMNIREHIVSLRFWESKAGLGNRLLPSIRDVRDDLDNLQRHHRRQLRRPDQADGDMVRSSYTEKDESIRPSSVDDGERFDLEI